MKIQICQRNIKLILSTANILKNDDSSSHKLAGSTCLKRPETLCILEMQLMIIFIIDSSNDVYHYKMPKKCSSHPWSHTKQL